MISQSPGYLATASLQLGLVSLGKVNDPFQPAPSLVAWQKGSPQNWWVEGQADQLGVLGLASVLRALALDRSLMKASPSFRGPIGGSAGFNLYTTLTLPQD